MIRSKADAQSALADLEHDLAAVVREALQDYSRLNGPLRHAYTKRSEASVIHDYMCRQADRRFRENPRVKIVRKPAFLLCVDGDWLIKPKKLDGRLRPRGIPTQSVLSFMNQEGQYILPGVIEPTNVVLGYQREEVAYTSSAIYLVCPNGGSLEWAWALSEEAGAGHLPPPVPHTPIPQTDSAEENRRRVRPKHPARDVVEEPASNVGEE